MATSEDSNPEKDDERSHKMSYHDAVIGKEIHNFWGGKVIEHTTATGAVLALKVMPRSMINRSEGDLMHYAATHGVLAPQVSGIYDVQTKPRARVMVSERVPGVPLADIWQAATEAEQAGYKDQLRAQLARMRGCTQPFIGRVDPWAGESIPTFNVFDRLHQNYFGPFQDEDAFDEWCLARALPKTALLSRYRLKRFMQREQQKREASGGPGKFVLTHGDLSPRNIMAKDGVITGIIDWARGGFFPEYAEYAFAMVLGHGIEKWWIPVLKEILQPCSNDRLKFTKLVEDRGW